MGYRDDIDDPRYWTDRQARMDAEARYAIENPLTDGERLTRAIIATGAITRENGFTDEEIGAAHAHVQVLEARIQAQEHADRAVEDTTWTRKLTISRRQEWNALAKSPQYRGKQGAIQAKVGYAMGCLQRQVKRWAL